MVFWSDRSVNTILARHFQEARRRSVAESEVLERKRSCDLMTVFVDLPGENVNRAKRWFRDLGRVFKIIATPYDVYK